MHTFIEKVLTALSFAVRRTHICVFSFQGSNLTFELNGKMASTCSGFTSRKCGSTRRFCAASFSSPEPWIDPRFWETLCGRTCAVGFS